MKKWQNHLFVFSLLGLVPHCLGNFKQLRRIRHGSFGSVCVTHCVAVVHLIFYAYTYVCKYVDQQQLGYHAGHQEASRYHTRGESEESITHR